jgi:uncharacterized protein
MRIRVDEIPESGRLLHFHWDEQRFRQLLSPDDPFELGLERPLNVDLEIHRHPDHIKIEGSIEAVLTLDCHRCLSRFTRPFSEPVDIVLVKERAETESEELELQWEDQDYDFFDGEVIEIDHLVVEQVFLALPVKVLCSESCKGLCSGCGANLNEEPCKCAKPAKASPFDKLSAIFEPKTGPSDS